MNKKESDIPSNFKNLPGSEEDLMTSCSQEDEEFIASFVSSAPRTSHLIPMSLNQEVSQSNEKFLDRQKFWIRIADTKERREQAGLLVDRMYAWRLKFAISKKSRSEILKAPIPNRANVRR